MSLIVPNAIELLVLQSVTLLNQALTLRLFSNNVTPDGATAVGAFTEVTGGGYANKPLTFANWGFTSGNPSEALYNAVQQWTFTGATGGPGTIYGYYVTKDTDGSLLFSERFPAANVPFVPINGSLIRVLPRFTAQSQF